MQWKSPKNSEKYFWTAHVAEKMHFYGLSEQKVLGVIRAPKRIETGIVENTVAVMIPVGNIKIGIQKPKWGRPVFGNRAIEIEEESGNTMKSASAQALARQFSSAEENWNQEIWVMYQTKSQEKKFKNKTLGEKKDEKIAKLQKKINTSKQITIISAWRFPGVSPKTNPIPEDILREIEEIGLK